MPKNENCPLVPFSRLMNCLETEIGRVFDIGLPEIDTDKEIISFKKQNNSRKSKISENCYYTTNSFSRTICTDNE